MALQADLSFVRLSLHFSLVPSISLTNEIQHPFLLMKQDFDCPDLINEQNMLKECHNILQHQNYTFSKLKIYKL